MKNLFAVDLKELFKGLIISIVGTALILCLFFIAYSLVFNLVTAKPDKMKEILDRSSLYEELPGVIYDGATAEREGSLLEIPLKEPEIRRIALDVYDPQFARSNIENAIDGLYSWLEGNTDQPNLSINFTGKNKEFAKELGKYAEKKAKKLPPCSLKQQQELNETNVFKARCWPSTISPATAGKEVEELIAGSDDSVLNTNLSAEDLKDANGKPIFQNLSDLPQAFAVAKSTLPALIILVFPLAAALFYLSKDKISGFRRIGHWVLGAGILLILLPALFSIIINVLANKSAGNNGAGSIVQTILQEFTHEASKIYYAMGVLLVLAAIGLYFYARRIQGSDKVSKPKR